VEEVLRHGIHGLSVGCVYALVATGLVLTYRTAGVFNLAFGAQAFVSAAVFYELRETNGWALVPALVVAVGVVAPLLGAVLDRVLFRHLRTRGTLAKLVVALALMVAIPALVQIWFGAETKFNPPSVAPDPDRVFRFGDQFVNADEMTTVVVTILVVIALTVLLRWTALGLKMRAVVESPRMVELAGVNADRVGTTAWMLASGLAGVAGVLLAPLFQTVDAQTFTVLLVAATAAAAFGRLTSIPLTLAGGVALGVMQQVVASYVEPDSVWARGLRPSLPFIVLVGLLLLWAGRNRRRRRATATRACSVSRGSPSAPWSPAYSCSASSCCPATASLSSPRARPTR
jgi:branched-chain amino acid transport system permease protein